METQLSLIEADDAGKTDFSSGAEFSQCRTFRYVLWRRWAWEGYANQVMFVGLNPSTADETEDDPTIRRCIRFARDWGYSGILMMNAFAFRATDPKVMKAAKQTAPPLDTAQTPKLAPRNPKKPKKTEGAPAKPKRIPAQPKLKGLGRGRGRLKKAPDPVGPDNDKEFGYRRTQVGLIVAAWGVHCPVDRERAVCDAIGRQIHCLGVTKAGAPKHPLYLRADTQPEIWTPR